MYLPCFIEYQDMIIKRIHGISTNNTLERLNREMRRQTKVIGDFLDGESALILVCTAIPCRRF